MQEGSCSGVYKHLGRHPGNEHQVTHIPHALWSNFDASQIVSGSSILIDQTVGRNSNDIAINVRDQAAGEGRKTYYSTQTGIANGYPHCYLQFYSNEGKDAINHIAYSKIKKTRQTGVDNAITTKSD